MRYSDEVLTQIKNIPIIHVASKLGIDYKVTSANIAEAVCPFHPEDTPSFKLHLDTNSYSCYGCGAGSRPRQKMEQYGNWIDGGSDVIGLVINKNKSTFFEAVKFLAEIGGVELPEEQMDPEVRKILDMKAQQVERLRYNLSTPDGMLVQQYLQQRGMTIESMQQWEIGYVPNNYSIDIYRNRIAFPLHNEYGRPIGLAYRTMEQGKVSDKYINDKNNAAYNKSYFLFGMHFAKQAIRETGYVIVVEGYMDVIMLHQVGIRNVVGICGTSLTDEQIGYLKTLTTNIVMWLDNDQAGEKNTKRVVPKLLSEGFKLDMIEGASGQDPADIVQLHTPNPALGDTQQNRAAIYQYMRTHRTPAAYYFIQKAVGHYEKEKIYLQRKVMEEVQEIMGAVANSADRFWVEDYLKKHLN